MSDNYKIMYSSKDQFFVMVVQKIAEWAEQLESVETKLMKISQMESFQGTTADSVKAYINEVYGILLISLRQTLAEFQTRLTLYTNGFYEFEPNLYATISKETLDSISQKSADERVYLDGEKQSIGVLLEGISDLVAISNPDQTSLQEAFGDLEAKIAQLDRNITSYESDKTTDVRVNLSGLIVALQAAINAYIQQQGCITGYQAGDYAQKTEILDLYEKVTGSMEYTEQNADELSEAAENMQEVFVQQQKDYEEACEARKDEGTANMILGGLAVVAGVTAIVLTAGAATPVVVVAAASGTCAAAYGVSNIVEGGQDLYYGSIGDLSTEAWNPIRDTVFCGNQQLYDTWGNLSMTVAALCVPTNAALNSVAGQGTKVVTKTVVTTVAKEYVKGEVIETVSDKVTGKIAEELNLNKTQTVILGEVLESGIEAGVDKATDAYVKHRDGAPDGDFTDRMSYEDAKRYNEFMDRNKNAVDSDTLASLDPAKNSVDTSQLDANINKGSADAPTADLSSGTKLDTPAADAPTVTPDAPATDAPAVTPDAPAADAPTVTPDAPAADAPTVTPDAPAADAPAVTPDAPATDAPAVTPDAPAADAPAVTPDAPAADAPAVTPDTPAADAPAVTPDTPAADAPAEVPTSSADVDASGADNGEHIDWERTANTTEEQAIIREMEENGEFIEEKIDRNGKVTYEDHGAPEVMQADAPKEPGQRMPTEEKGTIIGDRESGNFEFVPNNPETQKIMAKYGQDTIEIKNGVADFSPFDTHETPWGTVECEVEIGHMIGEREGTIDNPGNYEQADVELAKKISDQTHREVSVEEVRKYRKDNKLTWHETADCKTMQLVPFEINRDCAHTGGTSQSKYRMSWGDIAKDFT